MNLNRQFLKKWTPIINSILFPYEINEGMIPIIGKHLQDCVDNGINYESIMMEFKAKLLEDEKLKIKIDKMYYHTNINRIVYELNNGDTIYLDPEPIIVKNDSNITSTKDLFESIINNKG